MKIFSRISLIIMAIAALQGCGETTFDADNYVDSFIELSESATNEADKQLLYDLWDVYLRGYVDHDGNVVEPDFAKLDGMNAQETLQELKNHIDYVQFEGFEFATVDDEGNYVDPNAAYGSGGPAGSGRPSVDINVRGTTISLTAIDDLSVVKGITVNRGNCNIKDFYRVVTRSPSEVERLRKEDPTNPFITNKTREIYSPFPSEIKFGETSKFYSTPCNIIEVTVIDANGTWTWEFES